MGEDPEIRSCLDRISYSRRTVCGALAFAPLFALGLGSSESEARSLDAAAFGWRTRDPGGPRRLLVIWVREPDGTSATEISRRKQHFETLLFGQPNRDTGRVAPSGFAPNLVGYFRDQSAGQFTWQRVGFIGPLSGPVKGKAPREIAQIALTAAAREGHVDFRRFDTNRDGKILREELAILILVNEPHAQANHFLGNRGFAIPGQDVVFAGGSAVMNDKGGLDAIVHELFHTLGGIDLYGPWGGCYPVAHRLTPMAATGPEGTEAWKIMNLDPWHKMLVGWIEPRMVEIGRSGRAELAAQHLPLSSESERKRPLLIYDPRKGRSEFFMLEYRTPNPRGYDAYVPTSGLVIWHIAYGSNGRPMRIPAERRNCRQEDVKIDSVFVRGGPDWQQGISKAYTSVNGRIAFKWMNGEDSGLRLVVAPHRPVDPILKVSWTSSAMAAPISS